MKKIFALLTCLIVIPLFSQITVRLAIQDDLPELLNLDLKVSLEDFVPLVPQYYTEYFTTQQYVDLLVAEVEKIDRDLYQKSINLIDDWRVHVAIDEESKKLVGYALYTKNGVFSKKDKTFWLEFVAVDSNWRRHGIGSQLVKAALDEFDDINFCDCAPLQCNKASCSFLESIGFINKGPGPADLMNVFGFGNDKWCFIYQLTL